MKNNRRAKKILLILACLGATAWCCYIVAASFREKAKPVVWITPIRAPQHLEKDTSPPRVLPPVIIKNILRFKKYMDTVNPKVRDSILAARPGLLDSISNVEQIYQIR